MLRNADNSKRSEFNIFNELENPEKPQVTFQDSVLVPELVRMGLYPYPRC